MGSPPPAGSKNAVFRLRSVNSIVIAPASTGRDNKSKTAVMVTDQTNKGIRSRRKPCQRILIAVVIKLIAPRIDDTPAKCREKITISTEGPAWARFLDKGG